MTTTTYSSLIKKSICDDLPQSITTTTVLSSVIYTLYKSAVQNQPVQVSQPKPNATQAAKAKPPPQQRQQQQ